MQRSPWQTFDWWLLLFAVILTTIGIAMIYSATRGSLTLGDQWRKQALYAVVGVVILFMVALVNYRLLESLHWPIYIVTLGLLGFTLMFGKSDAEFGNVRRFIYVGGTSIQPAFPALILLILCQASVLARRTPDPPELPELLTSLAMAGAAAGLVFKQPNLSTATLYVATWAIMLFASGINLSYLQGMGILGLLALPIVWNSMDSYMRQRVFNFLNPANDKAAYYNIEQALISVGSGGLMGKGFAIGTQSQLHFLRVRHTDFIFSVISEELGFVGVTLIFLIFLGMLWRMLYIAGNAGDVTGKLIVVGVITYIFYQLIINIGMNLSMIPVAGLPLPFISSGGSSLVITFVGLGLVEGVAMRRKTLDVLT